MTAWSTTTEHQPSEINNGNKYGIDDNVSLESLNAIVENSLCAISEADDAKEIAQEALNQTIADGINPNMLINGDFQVNQRGSLSYSAIGYTVDRWYKNGYHTITINADGTITDTKNDTTKQRYIIQYIENFKLLLGNTYTISIKYSGATVGNDYRLGMFDGSDFTNYTDGSYSTANGLITFTFTIPADFSGTKLGVIYYPNFVDTSGDSITIHYIKLEKGSIATQHYSRTYAEELALCQRYYVKIGDSDNYCVVNGFSWGTADNTASIFLPLAVTLRDVPIISIIFSYAYRNSVSFNATASSVMNHLANGERIRIISDSNYSAGDFIVCFLNGTLDAEIY